VFGALTGGFGSVSRIGDIASVVVSRLFGGKAADAVREAGVCKRYRQSLVQIQNWNNNDYEAADQDTEALAAAARDADDFLNRPDHLKMICQESCNSQRWQIALKSVFSFNPVATIKNFSVKVIPGSEISVDESTGAVNCNCGIAPRKR
jgi:hypothetical protein